MGVYGTYGAFNGLGKPSIKLEFEDNESLVAFSKKMQDEEPAPVQWNEEEEMFVPVEGYGDKYIVTDLRQRAKKEPGEVKSLTKFQFSKFKNAPELFEPVVSVSPSLFGVYPVFKGINNDIVYFEKEFSDNYNADFVLKDYVVNKSERLVILNFARYKAYGTDGVSIVSVWSFSISCPVCNIITAYSSKIDAYFGLIEFTEGLIAVLKNAQSKLRSNSKDYKTLQFQIERWQDAANQYADGLGAPGDTYIITDTRTRARKDLEDTAAFRKFDVKKVEGGATSAAAQSDSGVVLIPIFDLNFDTKNFQNREDEYSETSVNRIIDAVADGEFNWAVFDPITVWHNPSDGKIYVLSGHSRSEAFRRLAMQGAQAQGRKFDKIPAKIFDGTFEQARELALNSNTLSTKETDIERANYYRERRAKLMERGGKPSEIRKQLLELARKNEGKNANRIIYLSYLTPRGITYDALKNLQNAGTQDRERMTVAAEWIGHLRYQFPQLTEMHENELYRFLITNGHYGSDVRNFADFAKRVQTAIEKNTEWGNFNADKALNMERNLGKSENEKRYDAELARLKKEWVDADDTLTRKLGEFKARQRKDNSISDAQIVAAARPYKDAALIAKANYLAFRDKRGQYLQADERQMALFGKVANDALYNNLDILDYRGMQPTYRQLSNYDAFFKPATNKNSLKGWGLNDTKKLIADICRNHYKECAAIAKHLKAETKLQSAFNLWHWLHHNVRYEYDREGREEVRTPSRTWADRHRGVDCDCLSVFAWCVLKCMGYNPAFELAAFRNKPAYSHIYINLDGIVVDRVWFVFNSRPPGVTKTELFKVGMLDNLGQLF